MHLRKKHGLEDYKIDKKLGPRASRRRPCRRPKGTVIKSDLLPLLLPPPIESNRQCLVGPQQHSLTPSLLDVEKDANHAFQPLVPSVAYNTWLRHGEPSELERHASTLPPGLLSEEESTLVNRHFIGFGWYIPFYMRHI
jgi:hypothetical protein